MRPCLGAALTADINQQTLGELSVGPASKVSALPSCDAREKGDELSSLDPAKFQIYEHINVMMIATKLSK